MNHDLIIARYGEIGLKSPKIRSRFEKKLVENIKATFECEVERNQGRIYIHPENFTQGIEKLNKVFGVVSFSPATSTSTDKINKIEWKKFDYNDEQVSSIVYMYEKDNGTYVITIAHDAGLNINLENEIKEFMNNVRFE